MVHIIVYGNGAPWSFEVHNMCGHKALALPARHKLDHELILAWLFLEADAKISC